MDEERKQKNVKAKGKKYLLLLILHKLNIKARFDRAKRRPAVATIPSNGDHVPLIPITTAGDVDALLVQRLSIDRPTGGQNLRAHLGRRVEENGALAEVRGRVHGGAGPARGEVDGRRLREEGDDVDVVRDAGGVLGQWPGVVRVGVVGGHVLDGLRSVEEEDVFLVGRDGHFGVAGFEGLDEDGRHLEEGAVVEVAVVVGSVGLHELGFGGGVGRADVMGFAVVVPGDDFDVIGLELQQVIPSVNIDVGVLRIQPVGVAGQALEEPWGDACHPDLAVGSASVGERFVDRGFFVGGEGRMDPSEGTCAAIGEGGFV